VRAAACTALLALATGAAAQEATREAESAPRLDDIVVTAQKSEQLLEQVPLSMTALDGDLSRTGANDLYDLSLYVPNLRIDGDDLGATSLYIRGLGSNSLNSSVESGVGFVQDEVYFGRNGYVTDALFDVDRIEILRGPQGTLFGKNTVAGLVSVTSVSPRDEAGLDLQYRRASHGEGRVEGGADLPLGDWGAVRIAGMYRDEQGELANSLLGRGEEKLRQHGARAKLRFAPFDGVNSELAFVDTDTVTASWPLQLLALDADTRDYLDQFDARVEDDPRDFRTSFDTAGFLHKGSRTGSLKTTWDLGAWGALAGIESTTIMAASRFWTDRLSDLDVSPADLARLANNVDYRQHSVEQRFSGSLEQGLFGWGESARLIAGLFWFESSTVLRTRILAGEDLGSFAGTCDFAQLVSKDLRACDPGAPPPPPVTVAPGEDYLQLDFTPDVRSAALFGQLTWELTDRWVVSPAVRVTHERKLADVRGNSYCRGDAAPSPGGCVIQTLLDGKNYDKYGLRHEETDVAPRLAVQYFTDADDHLYASYALGYKGGGYNFATYDGVNIEFEREKAQTVELGAKGRAFGDTLRYGVSVFDTEFTNLQVFQAGVITNITNAAAATSRGVEAELRWLTPLPALSVAGTFGWLDARYRRYPGAPAPIDDGIGMTQDLDGKRMAFAPSLSVAVMPRLDFLLGSYAAQVGADALYQGDQYTDVDLDEATYVPAHWKLGARVKVTRADEAWSLTLGGSNLTDERVLNQVLDAILFPETYFAQQSAGRTLFASLGIRL